MTDTKTTLTWVLKDEVSATAGRLGATLGGLVNPTTLAIGAVAGLVTGLGLAAKAAADEQVNVAKLDAALKANVPSWDGNTDAIEELISQRENLAFSDDELRASLALLLPGTNDVTEAQELQAAAMDLARLKGVDLETATTAIAKASEGSTRELKAMGISLRDGATDAEVLAAVAAAAAGQAEAYAGTSAAKWETLQIKFGDVVETVGNALLPIIEDLLDFLIETAIPALEDFADIVGPILQQAFAILGPIIGTLVDEYLKPAIKSIQDLIGFIEDALNAVGALVKAGQDAGLFATADLPAFRDQFRGSRQHGGPVEAGGAYLVGEHGPEMLQMGSSSGMISPSIPGGSSGVTIVGVSEAEILDMVDRGLYFRLRSASPTLTRF